MVRRQHIPAGDVVGAIAVQVVELLAATDAAKLSGEGQLLTVAEAAARARCSTRTLRRALHAGRLRANQPAGRGGKLLIAVADLDGWLFGRNACGKSVSHGASASRARRSMARDTPNPISIDEIHPRRR